MEPFLLIALIVLAFGTKLSFADEPDDLDAPLGEGDDDELPNAGEAESQIRGKLEGDDDDSGDEEPDADGEGQDEPPSDDSEDDDDEQEQEPPDTDEAFDEKAIQSEIDEMEKALYGGDSQEEPPPKRRSEERPPDKSTETESQSGELPTLKLLDGLEDDETLSVAEARKAIESAVNHTVGQVEKRILGKLHDQEKARARSEAYIEARDRELDRWQRFDRKNKLKREMAALQVDRMLVELAQRKGGAWDWEDLPKTVKLLERKMALEDGYAPGAMKRTPRKTNSRGRTTGGSASQATRKRKDSDDIDLLSADAERAMVRAVS